MITGFSLSFYSLVSLTKKISYKTTWIKEMNMTITLRRRLSYMCEDVCLPIYGYNYEIPCRFRVQNDLD